ncbi:MAG: T9SS type A sorting domain-containing protein, partial [Cytophagales bacterium]|nr:T9SS type A sorting domain-containing protein [Cytophaga sp.]
TNKGTAPLILTKSGGKYVTLGNTGATDFTIDESALTGTIAAGKSQTFSVALNTATATNGTKTVSMTILNNDILPANKTYVGSIKYTLASVVTSIVKASDIGLSLYPNPSNDGHFSVKADNIDVNRIVVSNVNGVTEEFTSKEFSTHLKGLLLIQVYTSKGLVSEKVIVQ